MKPLTTLYEMALELRWDMATMISKRDALTRAYKEAAFEDPLTLATFAHGRELVRVRYNPTMPARSFVETYDVLLGAWQKHHYDVPWIALEDAAALHAHPDGRSALAFLTLPIHISPEASSGAEVTLYYPGQRERAQGWGVFQQVDRKLQLVAAYHRGYEARARLLTCELQVEDENGAGKAAKLVAALRQQVGAGADKRLMTQADLQAFARANRSPSGTKFPELFDMDPAIAMPVFVPTNQWHSAWAVADFLDFVRARPALKPVCAALGQQLGLHTDEARQLTLAREVFEFADAQTPLDDRFDVRAFVASLQANHGVSLLHLLPERPATPAAAASNPRTESAAEALTL